MSAARRDDRPVTVRDALELDVVQAGAPEVRAGEDHLDRPVRWVHAGEFSEMAAVLQGGELLLTTGMGLSADDRAQGRWVAMLADRGIAGVILELGSALDETPTALEVEARARSLPLIVLHRQIPFVEITERLHRRILGSESLGLRHGVAAQTYFTELALNGAEVPDVVGALARRLAAPVVLARADGRVLWHESRELGIATVLGAWEAVRRDLKRVAARAPIHLGRDPEWGELAVLPVARPVSEVDVAETQQAARVIDLLLAREGHGGSIALRARSTFVRLLLDEARELAELDLLGHAAMLGFEPGEARLLPVGVDTAPGSAVATTQEWDEIVRRVVTIMAGSGPVLAGVADRDGPLAAVCIVPRVADRGAIASRVADALHAAAERAESALKLVVCVGEDASSFQTLRPRLREAVATVRSCRLAPAKSWHDVTSASLNQLLWQLGTDQRLKRFVSRRLEAVMAYDAARGSDLVHTLEVFCASGGRKAQAARDLCLERQSLYKRLRRIEDLIRGDLDDEDTRLALHVALKARRVLISLP